MPLPITKPVQSSIRSFFTSSTPNMRLRQKNNNKKKRIKKNSNKKNTKSSTNKINNKNSKNTNNPTSPSPPPLKINHPPSATIRIPTEADLPPFRRINALLLQVAYNESYYASTLHDPLSRVITWSHDGQAPKVVGAVVCLIEDEDEDANTNADTHDPLGDEAQSQRPKSLYIRSMCLLAPYRGLGLAQAALEDIFEGIRHRNLNFVSITAHVWTENEDGLRWYKGRGFEKDTVKPLEGYYLRLRPGTAWLVRKTLLDSHGVARKGGLFGQRNGNGKGEGEGEGEERGVVIPESVTAAVVNMPPSPPPPPAAAAAAAAAASSAATTPASGPASTPTLEMRPTPISGQSFQNQRPETEWNDLPEDMAPPRASGAGAGAGSRSASAGGKKKRDRSYPAAAFGS